MPHRYFPEWVRRPWSKKEQQLVEPGQLWLEERRGRVGRRRQCDEYNVVPEGVHRPLPLEVELLERRFDRWFYGHEVPLPECILAQEMMQFAAHLARVALDRGIPMRLSVLCVSHGLHDVAGWPWRGEHSPMADLVQSAACREFSEIPHLLVPDRPDAEFIAAVSQVLLPWEMRHVEMELGTRENQQLAKEADRIWAQRQADHDQGQKLFWAASGPEPHFLDLERKKTAHREAKRGHRAWKESEPDRRRAATVRHHEFQGGLAGVRETWPEEAQMARWQHEHDRRRCGR